jgi:hypothetical protein
MGSRSAYREETTQMFGSRLEQSAVAIDEEEGHEAIGAGAGGGVREYLGQ